MRNEEKTTNCLRKVRKASESKQCLGVSHAEMAFQASGRGKAHRSQRNPSCLYLYNPEYSEGTTSSYLMSSARVVLTQDNKGEREWLLAE